MSLHANSDTADNDFGEDPDIDIVSFSPNSGTYANADYAKARWGESPYVSVSFSDFRAGIGGYVGFTLNEAGRDYINKTGRTDFGARYSRDTDNSAPTWSSLDEARVNCHLADTAGTANDPRLVIEHAAGGGGGFVPTPMLQMLQVTGGIM